MKRKILLFVTMFFVVLCSAQTIKEIDIQVFKEFTMETVLTITPMAYEEYGFKDSIKIKNCGDIKKVLSLMKKMKVYDCDTKPITEEYSPIDVRGKIVLKYDDNTNNTYYISPITMYQKGVLYGFPKKLKVFIDKLFGKQALGRPFHGEYS